MARSSSSFRSLVLFLLEHFLLSRVEINLSAKDELLKCENCRSSRSFVLYFPQKTLCHFSMSFLLDVLCCHVLSWNSIVNKLFGIDVMIHAGQDDFIVSQDPEFPKTITPPPPPAPLITYNDAYNINIFEIGRASRDCGFHKFWGCKFLGL